MKLLYVLYEPYNYTKLYNYLQTGILAPSEPRGLRALNINSTAIHLQWEEPGDTNGDIRLYQLQYKPKYLNQG